MGTATEDGPLLVQSGPNYRPTTLGTIIKSLTARASFPRVPTVTKRRWGGEFWSTGSCISPVGRHGHEAVMRPEVRQQGREKGSTRRHRQDVQLGGISGAHAGHTPETRAATPPNWRAIAVRKRGFDTSQLAAG